MNDREMPSRLPRPNGPPVRSLPLPLERPEGGGESRQAATQLDFERVYTEYFDAVTRWARALGGRAGDVDDLAQDVFLVVRRKLASYDGRSLSAWLYGITRKVVSDYRRRAWIRRLLGGAHRPIDALPLHEHTSGADAIARGEAQRIVYSVLERMSVVRRSAFILFEIEGYSGEEIAALEQIPVATVYTRLHHARKDFLRLTAELTGVAPGEHEP